MSVRSSASSLAESYKQLLNDWQRTQESWHDVKSRDFEQRYLGELPQQIARAMRTLEELDVVLRKIKHDCE
jgi:hypothetical protein